MKPHLKRWIFGRHRRWLVGYLILLAVSFLFREWVIGRGPPADGWRREALSVVYPEDGDERAVTLAWQEYLPAGLPDAPVLVLIHGTRSSESTVAHLVRYLKDDFRLIIPDLPGFGQSRAFADDFSAAGQARVVGALIDHLDLKRVHLLGFSLGGVVVVEYADAQPEGVQSITLVSAVGVEESDLLGDRMVNHSLYTLQWLVLAGLQHLTPHFGLLDAVPFNRSYAAFLRDTDLRPVQAALRRFEGPALVIHGRDDRIVSLEAAREHSRLLPQSERVELPGGHGLVYERPAAVADCVADFVIKAESGRAVTRATAGPDRTAAAVEPTAGWAAVEGVGLWMAGVALAVATLVSEDLTCIAAGLLVAREILPFWAATLACLVGIVVGDIVLLLIGRGLRRIAWESSLARLLVRREAILHAERWIERKGPAVALISRFMPGTRLATYLAAGLLGVSVFRFSVYFLVAAGLWTPALVGLSAVFGSAIMAFWADYDQYALTVLLLIALGFFGLFKLALPLLTHRGRRLLWSRYQRLMRWEFWPPWIFYPPVVMHILWLGLRFRNATLFTASNPGIPESGLLGESKSAILGGMVEAGSSIAAWRLLPGTTYVEKRMEQLTCFMTEEGLRYPIVLKPDVGQRGSGVVIAQSTEEARRALGANAESIIAQAYIEGPEFGIFYVRRPSEEIGRILSITEKRRLWLVGDGVRTVEELILDDDRAVCMARYHLRQHASRIDDVPARGEIFRLVEIGAHCRGSLFLDGARIRTPALEEAVDRIAKCSPGFFFGRFDLRAPSEESFRRGADLKVLELNGVSSESTDIYDPANSLFAAYRVLFNQWRLAFEIGAENQRLGRPTTPPLDLLRIVLATWAGPCRQDGRNRLFPALTDELPVGNARNTRAK